MAAASSTNIVPDGGKKDIWPRILFITEVASFLSLGLNYNEHKILVLSVSQVSQLVAGSWALPKVKPIVICVYDDDVPLGLLAPLVDPNSAGRDDPVKVSQLVEQFRRGKKSLKPASKEKLVEAAALIMNHSCLFNELIPIRTGAELNVILPTDNMFSLEKRGESCLFSESADEPPGTLGVETTRLVEVVALAWSVEMEAGATAEASAAAITREEWACAHRGETDDAKRTALEAKIDEFLAALGRHRA